MANPNDPALEAEKRALSQRIDDLQLELASASDGADTSALEAELTQLEAEMKALQKQRKVARDGVRVAATDADGKPKRRTMGRSRPGKAYQ